MTASQGGGPGQAASTATRKGEGPGQAASTATRKGKGKGRGPRPPRPLPAAATATRKGPGPRPPRPLPAASLYQRCPVSLLRFRSTADLAATQTIVGQDRALEAIDLAVGMPGDGFNVFAMGPPGTGKSTALRERLGGRAASEPVPDDWCYVHDFADPQRPRALRLPAGRGIALQRDMAELTAELPAALLAAFESDAYREQRDTIESRIGEQRSQALAGLEERASAAGIAVVRTPVGLALAPTRKGQVLGPDEFHALPEEEQTATRALMEQLGEQLEAVIRALPRWQRETRQRIRELDRGVTAAAVKHLMDEVRADFADLPHVLAYLDAVEADIVEHSAELLAVAQHTDGAPAVAITQTTDGTAGTAGTTGTAGAAGAGGAEVAVAGTGADVAGAARADPRGGLTGTDLVRAGSRRIPARTALPGGEESVLRRYGVNVLVDRSGETGAPYVTEDHPSVANLVGRVEYLAQMGTLVTDFMLIRPGALHRANGGYLVLEAVKVLSQPYAWEHLKRTLRAGAIHIESLGQSLGLLTTVALEPEAIPLRVKVALIGDRMVYYLLCSLDPDFGELFKVEADFEDEVERTPEAVRAYASLMGTLAARESLRPLDRTGVARALEHLSRLAADGRKLSTRMGRLTDLLREADHVAGARDGELISAADVQAAIDARERRGGRVRERMGEALRRGRLRVRTDGTAVGQVNALSVMQLGETAFGHPSRVTARARLGSGDIVDIEREVELGGPIHSKGVLILSGFLAGRFGSIPLSISASLVFEQTYGGVEGDSASLAELCALLSAIGGLPISQSIAITGSVDQHGEAQPVGGVNEKIEGFFDACDARGLSGEQGVIIPDANRDDLMLASRVVEAARAGRFRVWTVRDVDEAMALLAGMRAGRQGADGSWPDDSVNGHVARALQAMATEARRWARESEGGKPGS